MHPTLDVGLPSLRAEPRWIVIWGHEVEEGWELWYWSHTAFGRIDRFLFMCLHVGNRPGPKIYHKVAFDTYVEDKLLWAYPFDVNIPVHVTKFVRYWFFFFRSNSGIGDVGGVTNKLTLYTSVIPPGQLWPVDSLVAKWLVPTMFACLYTDVSFDCMVAAF